MAYKSINPYNGEVVFETEYATDDEVAAKLDKAYEAFLSWRELSFDERATYMRRAAEIFKEREDELADLQTKEMGMLTSMSHPQAAGITYDMLTYYADHAEEFLANKKMDTPISGEKAYESYLPLGIIFAIEPWNAPYYQAVRPASGILMAGNVMILKHAAVVPGCAAAVEQVFKDAGLPEGVFTNIYATHDQSSTIIEDPRVRGVTLTGSDAAGSRVAEQAGKLIKPVVLELGGSDPQIVLADADLDYTAQSAMYRFFGAGQVCASNKRIIVAKEAYEEFIDQYKQVADQMVPGDPLDPATTIGPLVNEAAADEVRDQIKRAVEHGAEAVEVGPKVPEGGTWVQPTFLLNVTRDNPVFHEEIFGPVPMIIRAEDEDDAIDIANDSKYGLAGSIYGGDVEHMMKLVRRMDTGLVTINRPLTAPADLPFGGVKNSGIGKELGPEGIKAFVNKQLVVLPNDD